MAFTRDPNTVFKAHDSSITFHPPMNYIGPLHTGKQPVTYENVTLTNLCSQSLGFSSNISFLPVVTVDWENGIATIYQSSEDALDNLVWEENFTFRIPSPPSLLEQYMKETVQFLERGHSLLNPACICLHGHSSKRCLELGILQVIFCHFSYLYSHT